MIHAASFALIICFHQIVSLFFNYVPSFSMSVLARHTIVFLSTDLVTLYLPLGFCGCQEESYSFKVFIYVSY